MSNFPLPGGDYKSLGETFPWDGMSKSAEIRFFDL